MILDIKEAEIPKMSVKKVVEEFLHSKTVSYFTVAQTKQLSGLKC